MINDLTNWLEKGNGIYEYKLEWDISLEIHIIDWNFKDSIYDSNSNLYIIYNFSNNEKCYLKRKLLLNSTLFECIKTAYNDWGKKYEIRSN